MEVFAEGFPPGETSGARVAGVSGATRRERGEMDKSTEERGTPLRYVLLSLALVASGAHGQVEVTELEQAAPDNVTVVDCPAVFTVPISLTETGVKNGAPWSLEDYRCRGFEGLTIGEGTLIARKRGLRLQIQAHLAPSFDRLMRGRVDLLDRDKKVLVSREFTMEVEEGRWNNKWLKLGAVEDVSSIASLAVAVYSINED